MNYKDKIVIRPLDLLGKNDKGDTFSFSIRETENFIYIHRKKGTLSGNTYHTGVSRFTNPKLFVLLSGKIVFRYRHIEDSNHEEVVISEPSIIEVFPQVTHSVEAVDDIFMLECNSIADIEDDRHREDVIVV
tara:strand:- start:5756 stop:6151 length:396 start_codon:yes stop_codon:yes gene_type:complete